MKKVNPFLFLVLIAVLMSFKGIEKANMAGTYGVCGCEKEQVLSPQIALSLHENATFEYVDATNPNKQIKAKGQWLVKNNEIRLTSSPSVSGTPSQWIIDKNEKCLKTRKGLTFIRLCNVKACK
ncbi:MAG: hypothetical protein ACKVTZ_11465 [Bacteroidia bacterium]